MRRLNWLDWIALILLYVGGINWGLVGLFNLDLVKMLFGDMTLVSRIIYVLVGLATLYVIFSLPAKSMKKDETVRRENP